MKLQTPPPSVESRRLTAPDAGPSLPPQARRLRISPSWLVVAVFVGAGLAFVVSARSANGVVVGLLLAGTAGALLARLPARIPLLAAAGLLVLCVPLLIASQDVAAERAAELAFLLAAAGVVLMVAEPRHRHANAHAGATHDRGRDRLLLLCGVGALALVPLTWLGPGEMVNGGDTNYPLRAVEYVELRLSGWNWQIGAGVPNLPNLGTLSWSLLAWAFEALTGSPENGQRVMLALWFAAVPASFLFLMRTLTGRWRPAFLAGALVYALNPYFANAWSNVLVSTIGAAVAAPLLLALGLRLAPRAARPPAWLFAVWGVSALLLSLVSQSPQLLAVVLLVTAAGVVTLGRPLAWGRAGLLAGIAVGVNVYWLLPQLAFLFGTEGLVSTRPLETLGLAHWTTGISANTSFLNVFRSAGSWDWFESWGGEPYVAYADTYLEHPLLIAIALAIPVSALAVLAFRPSRVAVFFGAVTVLALALSAGLHPPFGFIYGWAMENVPLFGIFRSPWYKFGLATTLGFGVLVALGLGRVVDALKTAGTTGYRQGGLLVVAACLAALTAGWPILTGDLLLPDRQAPPGFRVRIPPHVTAAADWLRQDRAGARVLWLPRNSDVYRWGTATSPQPLLSYASDVSIVGEIPFSSSTAPDRTIALDLLDLLDQGRVDEALGVARLLGIQFVVVRGDVDPHFYGQSVESPEFLLRTLESSPSLREVRRFGPWTFFALVPSPPKIYATPSGIVARGSERDPARVATFLPPDALTLVTSPDAARSGPDVRGLVADWIERPGTAPAGLRATLVKVVASRYRIRPQGRGRVGIERLAQRIEVGKRSLPIKAERLPPLELATRARPLRLLVDKRAAPVSETWYLTPGRHVVTAVEPVSDNLVDDGSFESGHWMDALDAGPPPGAPPRLDGLRRATRIRGGTDGTHSLQLLSTGNRAAVFTRIDANAAGRSYSVELDYRQLSGRPASFALVTEGRTLREEPLPASTGWSTRRLLFDVPDDATTLDLYLYANSAGERAVVQFDSVRVRRLGTSAAASFSVQPLLRLLPREAGPRSNVESSPASPNLVADPSFEGAGWSGPIDAGPPRNFPGSVRGEQTARRVAGGIGGTRALELVSTGNRAAVYTRIAERSGGVSYRVSFDYRLVEGRAPSFALVTSGRTLLEQALPPVRRWKRYSLDFHAPADSTTLDLYLYTTSAGERSTTRFDEVDVVRLGGRVESIVMPSRQPAARRIRVAYERISPTRYRVRVRDGGGPFLLNLRENYDAGWRASSDRAEIGSHFRSNGYGNAWVVQRAERGAVIELDYRPERWVVVGVAGSLGTLALLLTGALVVGFRRRRATHQR